ncbi:MAG: hypothetical protein QXL51_02685 [Candidatus Aenigmatarchaeota archaeon]
MNEGYELQMLVTREVYKVENEDALIIEGISSKCCYFILWYKLFMDNLC